jgi:hypothetical protein
MKSARLLQTISMASLFALTACASPRLVTPPASGCAELVPEEWGEGVPSANYPADRGPLPKEPTARVQRLEQDLTDARVFGNEQTGQLDKANGRTKDTLTIVRKCEARDAAAVKRLTTPWWQRPFLPPPDS